MNLTRVVFLGFLLFVFVLPGPEAHAAVEIWVAPNGDDRNTGERDAPLASLAMAIRQARELRRLADPAIGDGIRIRMRGGRYELDQALRVRWEDSGTEDSPTTVVAAEGEVPVLSGGRVVEGWQPRGDSADGLPGAARGQVWTAEAPRVGGSALLIRDLWIGERRAQRAREADGMQLQRIIGWDQEARVARIPAAAVEDLRGIEGLEMVIHQMWAIAILRVESVEVVGEEARLRFREPEQRVQFEHPWPPVVIDEERGHSAFYLSNRLEFLDEPGEWYQDPATGRLYYWPREDEEMERAEAFAPVLETLVSVEGSADRPVSWFGFEGIRFRHSSWTRPSAAGHVPLQAGFFMYEAYKLRQPGTADKAGLENQAWVGRKPAAVELRHVRHTHFERCFFEQLAASGLDYVIGAKEDVVRGNVFRDIGGSGFVVGAFQEGGVETHVPYQPQDGRVICEGLRFENNLVTDVAVEDWGCVGVLAGYVREVEIAHNEIRDVAYTGISLGWGWTPTGTVMRDNLVRANHIHRFGKYMYDTGGIYTLSAQPGTRIEGNRIHSIQRPPFVHDPHHWSYIYLDEGSAGIVVEDNWTGTIKFSTNANGPGNRWRRNGPDVPEAIMGKAGLQAAYRDLLDPVTD